MFRFIMRFLNPEPIVPLGRWGHHWEYMKRHQKYYE